MTEEILIKISGMRMLGEDNEDEEVEMIVPGSYRFEEGIHKATYEEFQGDFHERVVNTILVDPKGKSLTVKKEGFLEALMYFAESNDTLRVDYTGLYGSLPLEIRTEKVSIEEEEDRVNTSIRYYVLSAGIMLSECNIKVDICSKSSANIHL